MDGRVRSRKEKTERDRESLREDPRRNHAGNRNGQTLELIGGTGKT